MTFLGGRRDEFDPGIWRRRGKETVGMAWKKEIQGSLELESVYE